MGGEKIDISKLASEKLASHHDFSNFDCGIGDLNEFIQEDAISQQEGSSIGVTHVFFYEGRIVGFCTLSSDKIHLSNRERKTTGLASKDYSSFPAVKIGRLGVQRGKQGKGIGSLILKFVIGKVLEHSEEIGCRFITVEAYRERRGWYEHRDFEYNEAIRETEDTVSMRYDLLPIKNYKKLEREGIV